jgi:hypothetical protein
MRPEDSDKNKSENFLYFDINISEIIFKDKKSLLIILHNVSDKIINSRL